MTDSFSSFIKTAYEKLKLYGIKKFLYYGLNEIKLVIINQNIKKSYSMLGEDLIIDKLLKNKKRGFYIDIGANDPVRFNNTKRFYDRGWRGINIEPNELIFERLKNQRPKDINLNIGILSEKKKIKFYNMNIDALSTFSHEQAKEYVTQNFKILTVKNVATERLDSIFSRYVKNKEIDFISIDTEGYDTEVLKSNDWKKWRPKLICVEIPIGHDEHNKEKDNFLKSIKYKKVYENVLNAIYERC